LYVATHIWLSNSSQWQPHDSRIISGGSGGGGGSVGIGGSVGGGVGPGGSGVGVGSGGGGGKVGSGVGGIGVGKGSVGGGGGGGGCGGLHERHKNIAPPINISMSSIPRAMFAHFGRKSRSFILFSCYRYTARFAKPRGSEQAGLELLPHNFQGAVEL